MGEKVKPHLADTVQPLMLNKGWKQADLARASGLSPQYVSDLLRKKRGARPSSHVIKSLSLALGIPVERLL